MTLRIAEVVLLQMRFHQGPGSKIRPALVLLDTGDEDVVTAPITSRKRTSEFDFLIPEWRAAGLNVPSVVRIHKCRIHKLTVIGKADIVRVLGILSDADRESMLARVCRSFCPSHALQ